MFTLVIFADIKICLMIWNMQMLQKSKTEDLFGGKYLFTALHVDLYFNISGYMSLVNMDWGQCLKFSVTTQRKFHFKPFISTEESTAALIFLACTFRGWVHCWGTGFVLRNSDIWIGQNLSGIQGTNLAMMLYKSTYVYLIAVSLILWLPEIFSFPFKQQM